MVCDAFFTFGEDTVDFVNSVILNAEDCEPIEDKADEVMPPKRIPCSSYDPDEGDTIYEEVGWELEINPQEVYAAYENGSKYGDLVKILDSDDFEIKVEYYALYDTVKTI